MSADHGRRGVLRALLAGIAVASPLGRAGAGRILSGPGPRAEGRLEPATPAAVAPGGSASARAVVARARRANVVSPAGAVDRSVLGGALGEAVARAVGEKTPVDAMRRLFRPSDVIGLKVNCIAGAGLSPHPELVALLTGWLQEAGVPARNLVVWDRTDRELKAAGFVLNRTGSGVRVMGTNDDYDWTPREWGPMGSCFARALLEEMTALINVGVAKDHDLAGVSLGMKNWYGAIHNPNKCHDDHCAPFVAHLAASEPIRSRLRLTVLDALTPQCHAGPGRSPRWIWPYGGVLVSRDPAAIETTGLALIEDRRREVGLPSLAEEKRAPRWLRNVPGLGLGETDPARIRVEDV